MEYWQLFYCRSRSYHVKFNKCPKWWLGQALISSFEGLETEYFADDFLAHFLTKKTKKVTFEIWKKLFLVVAVPNFFSEVIPTFLVIYFSVVSCDNIQPIWTTTCVWIGLPTSYAKTSSLWRLLEQNYTGCLSKTPPTACILPVLLMNMSVAFFKTPPHCFVWLCLKICIATFLLAVNFSLAVVYILCVLCH